MAIANIGLYSTPAYQSLVSQPQAGQNTAIQDLIQQFQLSQEQANKVNEQRYKDILKLYENLGQAGRTRIERETAQSQAQATQGLISRGLGNTTITSAVQRGISEESELARQQLEETVALQRAGVMERRTDAGPDTGLYASLLQAAAGQATGGQATVRTSGGGMSAGGSLYDALMGSGGGGSSTGQQPGTVTSGGSAFGNAIAGAGTGTGTASGLQTTPQVSEEDMKKYSRWLAQGWGWMIPEPIKSMLTQAGQGNQQVLSTAKQVYGG